MIEDPRVIGEIRYNAIELTKRIQNNLLAELETFTKSFDEIVPDELDFKRKIVDSTNALRTLVRQWADAAIRDIGK